MWAVFICTVALVSPAAAKGEVEWTVSIDEPAGGRLRVRLEVPLESFENRTYLDFTFPDSHDFSGSVFEFQAFAASESIEANERTVGQGRGYRVAIDGVSDDTIVVEYIVAANFYPPGSENGARRDARSILEPELGILRTRTIFAAGRHVALASRLTFELPDGWILVTPWDRESDVFIIPPNALQGMTEYLGIGPFDMTEVQIGATQYRLASMGAGSELVNKLPALLEVEQQSAGTAPRDAELRHSIILAPRGFIQGGSAGRRSVVQSPNPVTLAHEIFHWWNHSGIAAPEARWFSEGFTEYFAVRAALASGLISEMYAQTCFADFNGEMRYLEREGAVSLADASRRYNEREGQRLVYAKGALLAYWMDGELRKDGRELRAVLPIVFADPNRLHDNAALSGAFAVAFEGSMNEAFARYVEAANPLPDLGLPEATGKSGRTRLLPNK